MKLLRSFLIPIACFALAWALSRSVGKHFSHPAEPSLVQMAPSKTMRERPDPRKVSVEALAENFRTRPMNEWAGLWEEFAREASADDLRKLPRFFQRRRDGRRVQGDDLLQVLAREELAVRAGRPAELAPESFSALAERNPQAAWDILAKHNRQDFSTAALRTLAGKDPAEALRRLQAMPEGAPEPRGDGSRAEARRAAVWHTPLGAIFGAWARRDPATAAAAVMKLPSTDRPQAASHLGMTWSFHDGPAAIRYILDFDKTGEELTGNIRLDVMLRASFRTHPAETAKLMAESAMLRKVIGEPPNLYVAVKPWLEADPEGALAWLFDPKNDSGTDALAWLDLDQNPEIATRIVRGLAATGSPAADGILINLHRRDPDLALALADELGIALRENPELEEMRIYDDPAGSCDRWLAALEQHGDPADALAALGWTSDKVCDLAVRAARVFPDKAAELAKRVPASSLASANLWRYNYPEITRFWPELAGALDPAPESSKPAFPTARFRYDPAAAAESLLTSSPDADDVKNAVELWAPHDPQAARAWLSRLPESPARREGELALAKIQTSYDPEASLEILSTTAEGNSSGQLWEKGLRRLLYAGGDWQTWLARSPESGRDRLADELAGEAKLLDLLRRSGGK
jgi:PAS domain-containing protein